MSFVEFQALCRRLEATRSRLAKIELAPEFLQRLAPDEIPPTVAFLAGRAFPASDPRVLDGGSGRRRGWLSNYHLAVGDEAGGFAAVGKTFKGSRNGSSPR